jgi:hypothetical protein
MLSKRRESIWRGINLLIEIEERLLFMRSFIPSQDNLDKQNFFDLDAD